MCTFLSITLFLSVFSSCLSAAVPQIKTAGPGFFRMMLGEYEITALSDGTMSSESEQILMPNAPKDELLRARQRAFVARPITVACNAFLINTRKHLVLIDTGAGALMGNALGNLVKNLRASGYQPEQIDHVLITHLHIDHLGGIQTPNRSMTFPNAIVQTSQIEADFWLNPEAHKANTSAFFQKNFQRAKETLAPYRAAEQFKTFNSVGEILPGIRAATSFGHTPGHTHFFVESGGQTLIAWGDISHLEWAQFPNPALTVVYDLNQDQARKSRIDLFNLIAEKRYMVAAAHVAFPGMGHLRRGADDKGFEWVPIRYDSDVTRNMTLDGQPAN